MTRQRLGVARGPSRWHLAAGRVPKGRVGGGEPDPQSPKYQHTESVPGDSYVVAQGAQYGVIEEYGLNYIGIQNMI